MADAEFRGLLIPELIGGREFACSCGKRHAAKIRYISICPGALKHVPEALEAAGVKKPLVVCGPRGYEAAAKRLLRILADKGIRYSLVIIPEKDGESIQPSESAVGYLALRYDRSCDGILAVGSGVINDVTKVVGTLVGVPTVIVGTAPSMDGFASDNASMEVNGIKLSLPENCPAAIVCDTEILTAAPMRMLFAGLGDMIAKYTALCEWKIARIANEEYYCEEVAALVERSLEKVMAGAEGLARREEGSVRNVTEGLVLSGIGMAFAGVSRPASGLEHYFSHCWEMMRLSRGQRYDLHGIQVGIGTLITIRILKKLAEQKPDMDRVIRAADRFDQAAWETGLCRTFPNIAPELLEMEKKAGKNRREGRLERAQRILDHWDDIKGYIAELPSYEELLELMTGLGMPVSPGEIGYSTEDTVNAFVYSRDVRDKYLTSSVIWDLGYMEEFADWLRELYR